MEKNFELMIISDKSLNYSTFNNTYILWLQ